MESGVPDPSVLMVRFIQIDIEINPLSLRRNFELLVALNVPEIRADENLSHVPVPELVGLCRRLRIRFQIELLVRANEQEIEILFRPACADLSSILRNRVAVNIFFH